MPVEKLKRFLEAEHVKYVTISHSLAFTAQQVAESAHIAGRDVAKVVMVDLDGVMSMAVLAAPDKVDLETLRGAAGAKRAHLAAEEDFQELFPDVEVGAMPPFGNLYGMPVYVEENLAIEERIAFNAGTHKELIVLDYADFERLVQPQVSNFSL